ncbi:MAG: type II toxin-antitoxin system RelE/ParE family toxin [Gammaproteobacteria bacterium]|nr:type II toxin-antitoxin system RelE/ParE family toxin [Gammaproteobacteria bacterium]
MLEIAVYETNRFASALAKLSSSNQCLVEDEIDTIIAEPLIGEQKKGDLNHLWVHKFKIENQEWLLGYNWNKKAFTIHLLQLGSHENYYKDVRNKRKADFRFMK